MNPRTYHISFIWCWVAGRSATCMWSFRRQLNSWPLTFLCLNAIPSTTVQQQSHQNVA